MAEAIEIISSGGPVIEVADVVIQPVIESGTTIVESTPRVAVQDDYWRRELVFSSFVILTGAALLFLSQELQPSVSRLVDFNWILEAKGFATGAVLGGR